MDTSIENTALHVVMAVIVNERQEILVSLRTPKQYLGGLWEFPGGKVEVGEQSYQALCRELAEEVDLHVLSARPLMNYHYEYPARRIHFDVWQVH